MAEPNSTAPLPSADEYHICQRDFLGSAFIQSLGIVMFRDNGAVIYNAVIRIALSAIIPVVSGNVRTRTAIGFDPDEWAHAPERVLNDLEAIVHQNRVVTAILPGAISARRTPRLHALPKRHAGSRRARVGRRIVGRFRDVEGSVFFGVDVLGSRNDPATTSSSRGRRTAGRCMSVQERRAPAS